MNQLKKFFAIFAIALFCSTSFNFPAYSQLDTVTATCSRAADSAACFRELGWTAPAQPITAVRTSLSTASAPSPFNGFPMPSKEAVALVGGSAALWYLQNNDMQSLRDKALASAPAPPFTGGQGVGVAYNFDIVRNWNYNGATQTYPYNNLKGPLSAPYLKQYTLGYGLEWGIDFTNSAGSRQFLNSNSFDASYTNFRIQNVRRSDGQPDTYGNIPISLSAAAAALPSDSIYSQAAIAAAVAASLAASKAGVTSADLTIAQAAIAAALAGAALIPLNTADRTAANNAIASAQTVVDAAVAKLSADQAAKDKQVADKLEADRLVEPSKLPVKTFATSTNFFAYFLGLMASKFPLDIIYGATENSSGSPLCPSFTLFYYTWQACFLLPLITAIRWIVFISLSTKVLLEF